MSRVLLQGSCQRGGAGEGAGKRWAAGRKEGRKQDEPHGCRGKWRRAGERRWGEIGKGSWVWEGGRQEPLPSRLRTKRLGRKCLLQSRVSSVQLYVVFQPSILGRSIWAQKLAVSVCVVVVVGGEMLKLTSWICTSFFNWGGGLNPPIYWVDAREQTIS